MTKIKKHSIDRDIQGYCGRGFLESLIEYCKNPFEVGVISGLFVTGCRESELVLMKPENVNLKVNSKPSIVLFTNVPVLKRYSRKRREKYVAYRTFPARVDDPLMDSFLEYYSLVKDKYDRILPYSRVRVFQIVRKVGERMNKPVPFSLIHSSQLYPHWFRAQRARQLRHDYKFTDEELRDWFGWKVAESGMPSIYGKMSWIELAEKMGVKVLGVSGAKL